MITKEKIEEMKRAGALIVTKTTWEKWLKTGKARCVGRTRQAIGCVPVFTVNGIFVKTDWLLTYGHAQFEHLIPVQQNDIEKDTMV